MFVHDGHPGGAGFAERGHAVLASWLAATRAAIGDCECRTGCPSCVQSPKCGNGNVPLDKAGAVLVLDLVLAALRPAGRPGVRGIGRRRPAPSGVGPAGDGRGAVGPVLGVGRRGRAGPTAVLGSVPVGSDDLAVRDRIQ